MCQYCGCGDYFDLDVDLHEMAEYDIDAAYAEQSYRDAEAERNRRAEEEAEEEEQHFRYQDWDDQARIHEQIERDFDNNY